MNIKRFFGAVVALIIFCFLYGWLVHGHLLMSSYMQTPTLWRTEPDMHAHWGLGLFFRIVIALWFTYAFTQLFKNGGTKNGLMFGLYFGVFSALISASTYLWMPISAGLAWAWFFAAAIEGVIGGLIVGSIYKKGR